MHTYRKILFLLLLAAIAVFSCKKKTNEPSSAPTPTFIKDAVDTIIGVYAGEIDYYDDGYDTVDIDTFFVMKRESNKFCFYLKYYWGPHGIVCNEYNNSNIYTGEYPGELTFLAQKDSLLYNADYYYTTSGGVKHIVKKIFKGKKVR